MPPVPRQPPVRRTRAGIRRPSPTPRPGTDDWADSGEQPDFLDSAAAETTEGSDTTETTEALGTAGVTATPVTARVAKPRPTAKPAPGAKPSPRPKSRDAGRAKPADYQAAEAAVAEPEPEPAGPTPGPRRRWNPFVLSGVFLAVAAVLIGLAVWFKFEDSALTAATSNTALLDVARTSQVNQAATSAVETLFSYDYTNIAKTQNAATDLLLNADVRNKYASLMGEVERLAPQQKMVVTVKASRSAVVTLDGDRARVMVFVDQTATRADENQTSSGPAQLWVEMQYSGGKWKVADLDTYQVSQPPATSTPAPPPPSPGK